MVMISKRPIPLRRPNRSLRRPGIVLRLRRHRPGHQNRPPLRHRSLARSRVGVLHRNQLKRLILAACHTRVIRTNRPAVAVRTIRRRHVATEVPGETVEDTCHGAWDEDVVDIEVAAAIVGKIPTTRLVRSAEDPEVVVAEATAEVDQEVTAVDREGMAVDQATTVEDTTTDRLPRIIRWAATRAVAATTKDRLLGSSSTHDNRPTLPR
uniref:(northern house mosquito) hypothetical protein n=1 Tax=Culex pipiens TaxID=7175 RepID=A0A8D8HY93_CULPI